MEIKFKHVALIGGGLVAAFVVYKFVWPKLFPATATPATSVAASVASTLPVGSIAVSNSAIGSVQDGDAIAFVDNRTGMTHQGVFYQGMIDYFDPILQVEQSVSPSLVTVTSDFKHY